MQLGSLFVRFLGSALFLSAVTHAASPPFQITAPREGPPAETGLEVHVLSSSAPNADKFVFASYSSKLVPNDTNEFSDVFVWSRTDGTIRLLSEGTNGPANGASYDPVISRDGRFAAYVSTASNFMEDTNQLEDVYVINLETLQKELIVAPVKRGAIPTLATTRNPVISAEGRFVAYAIGRYEYNIDDIYVRDRATGTNHLAFHGAAGSKPLAIFDSTLWLRAGTNVYSYEIANEALKFVGTSTVEPAFSSDGSLVALQLANGSSNVIRRYHVANQVLETVVAATNKFTGYNSLSISDNGRIAFLTDAPLAPEDLDTNVDLYVTPPVGGSGPLFFASSEAAANGAIETVLRGALSPNGARVYYRVGVSVPGSPRVVEDFVRELSSTEPIRARGADTPEHLTQLLASPSGALFQSESNSFGFSTPSAVNDLAFLPTPDETVDSDADGIPDAWEGSMFGSLAQSGSGDPDGDGMSNTAEFLAGTDPNRADSVLKLEIVRQGPLRYLISSKIPKPIVVEYRDHADSGAWTSLDTSASAPDGRSSFVDAANVSERIYRTRISP